MSKGLIALPGVTFDPGSAAHHLDESSGDRQPEPSVGHRYFTHPGGRGAFGGTLIYHTENRSIVICIRTNLLRATFQSR